MRFNHRQGAALVWAALAASTLYGSGCSGQGQGGGFAPSDGAAGSGDDASSGSGSGSSGGGSSGSSGSTGLQLGDSSVPQGGMGTGTCEDGTYSGMFQCTFVFNPDASAADAGAVSADAGGLMVTGTITIQLMHQQGSSEAFIDTATGSFSGTALTFFAISADVGGSLNCNTGVFTGSLTNGMYSGFLFLNGTFSGPLNSQYNGTTFSFVDGVWLLTVPGQGSCPGTWSANYTGQ